MIDSQLLNEISDYFKNCLNAEEQLTSITENLTDEQFDYLWFKELLDRLPEINKELLTALIFVRGNTDLINIKRLYALKKHDIDKKSFEVINTIYTDILTDSLDTPKKLKILQRQIQQNIPSKTELALTRFKEKFSNSIVEFPENYTDKWNFDLDEPI